jgi:class 3 adenylate cyclase
MDVKLLIAIIGGVVGLFGAIVAYTKFLAQAPLEARVNSLEGELQRKEQELSAKSDDLAAKESQLAQLRDEYSAVLQDFLNYKGGRGGAVIKREIDNEMALIRNALGATESSILVPGPMPYSPTFVFLSIYGPAAAKLRKSKLPLDKGIAGRVFKSGLAHRAKDAYQDAAFSPVADHKGMHVTKSMLTVPIEYHGQTVGVAQFLNKSDGQSFTEPDESVALRAVQNFASKVSEFRRDPANFETLGLASMAEAERMATVLFCDLTASSSMYEIMSSAEVVDAINEYLERQADVVLRYGGAIDKYLGDGAMFVFNPRRSTSDPDHAARAVEAAVDMQRDFETLKRAWSEVGIPLGAVYNRIAVACGPVLTPIMGHPQFQQVTVFGDTVGRAAQLCEAAPRDRNVLIVDEDVFSRAGQRVKMSQLVGVSDPRPGKAIYEVEWLEAAPFSRRS